MSVNINRRNKLHKMNMKKNQEKMLRTSMITSNEGQLLRDLKQKAKEYLKTLNQKEEI